MENIIKLAVQKKGRLNEKSIEVLKSCGLDFSYNENQLKSKVSNFPLEFLFLRDDDIPGYVADGVADIGIVGLNVVDEKAQKVNIVKSLGFAKCRLSIAVPNSFNYSGLKDLQGKIIATSYPRILSDFLLKHNIQAEIHEISGSVEIAPTIGLTDAICDIVSTGSTLISNGLKEVDVIYRSEAVLIGDKRMSVEKQNILNKLLVRINAVNQAKHHKYILLNAPTHAIEDIKKILAGLKSPTVTPLAIEGWSSLQSVIKEDDFWEIIEKLKACGAEDILIVPIEKII